MTKSINLFGKECTTSEEILEAVYDEMMFTDSFIDEYGNITEPTDLDDIHDICCDEFDTKEEYEIFKEILYSDENTEVDFDFDTGICGGAFSSTGAFFSWKEGI